MSHPSPWASSGSNQALLDDAFTPSFFFTAKLDCTLYKHSNRRISMSSGLIAQLEGLFTGPYEWVKPWAEEVLSKLQPGENPWDVGLPALQDHFYPRASSTFTTQLWVLMGVFSV